MECVTLQKDGHIKAGGKLVQTDPLPCLGAMVELEGGYTLRSFFRMLQCYPVLIRLSPFLPGLMDQFLTWPDKTPEPFGVQFLEVGKVMEMIGFPGQPRLETYITLNGRDEGEEIEIKAHPVKTIVDLPVRLGRIKHKVFGDKLEEMSFETKHTLFEFIDGMAWQLGFHGSPMECALRR